MNHNRTDYAGIDVSARELVLALECGEDELIERTFPNTDAGVERLVELVAAETGPPTRVCLEHTGNFSDRVKWALHRAGGVRVSTPNPRRVRNYARVTAERGKTDRIDARVLLNFGKAVDTRRWKPAAEHCRRLRKIARRIVRLLKLRTMNRNQAYAESVALTSCECVDLSHERIGRALDEEIEKLRERALELIKADPAIDDFYRRVKAISGFSDKSIISVFGEILVLEDGLGKRQWVAFSGLDPKPWESGTLSRRARISREGSAYLRRALYHPAMTAIRWEPSVKAYYERLTEDKGKPKMVGVVAVMRKLLVALWGMKRSGEDFDGAKFHRPKFDSAA